MAEAMVAGRSRRIASIDWTRGFVMILMLIDHASMAFDKNHLSYDSAMYGNIDVTRFPGFAFFTRWMTHICAPTFVFLAGTALALSVEKKAAKGVNAWKIDKDILIRGAIIALLDVTVISLGSGRWTLQVLVAIGLSMMLMAPLRRLPSWLLLAIGVGWLAGGEYVTSLFWSPPGPAQPFAALAFAVYKSPEMVIKYPVFPWLSMMVLGWVFGRNVLAYTDGSSKLSPRTVMFVVALIGLLGFVYVRAVDGYGDMFMDRRGDSWAQWLFISKYPPSLAYTLGELGLMALILWFLMLIEPKIGVRDNGPFLVLGQAAMFYYLVHRLMMEVPATYFGLRGCGDVSTVYIVSAIVIVPLYFGCRWYRDYKAAHRGTWLRYF